MKHPLGTARMQTEIQQIYAFFCAVMYAGMLNSLVGLAPFPWGFLAESSPLKGRLAWRLLVSIVILNVAPILIFAWGYLSLDSFGARQIVFWDIVLIGLCSLSVFSSYRFYHFIIVSLNGTCIDLYDQSERISGGLTRLSKIRNSWTGHFAATIVYLLPLILVILLY